MSKQPDNPDLLQFGLENLLHDLQQQGGLDLAAAAILDLARRAGLTLTELKRHKAGGSPSSASWKDVASKFDLDPLTDFHQLPIFSFPVVSLPPSFHREVMKASTKWLDVYQERGSHDRDAARVRLMDAWHVPICALFKGRLVDKPESSMPETPESSGGEVEHEVHMIEGIMLLVFELKLDFKNEKDHVAQVLLELVSAYKLNSNREFNPQPPVYALLTDLRIFYFFRYDGSQFTRTMAMFVPEEPRGKFLAGMRRVSEHLFSVLLEGYIGMLAAVEARSTRRGIVGDVGKETPTGLKVPGKTRPSLGNWSQALGKACAAQEILLGCKGESLQSWEEVGCCGLFFLDESLSFLPKIGSFTYWDAKTSDDEIEKVLLTAIQVPEP